MTASLFPPARFALLPRRARLLILAALAVAIWVGLIGGVGVPKAINAHPPGLHGDYALYRWIVADVAAGEPYHAAAVREHRRWNYPTRPGFTVREPTLAVALAQLPGEPARRAALAVLTVGVLAAWCWRVQRLYGKPVFTAAVAAALTFGLMFAFSQLAYLFHECWAGLLIALSLALHTPRRWWGSVIVGTLAVLVRELALPYLIVMAGLALWERRRGEAAAWGSAVLIFSGVLFWHFQQVAALVQPQDLTSRGWLGLCGWPYLLLLAKWNGLLIAAPDWTVAVAVPLMLLGAVGWPGPLGARLAILVLGYGVGFMIFGRTDTYYWGLMILPLMALSLGAAPQGLCTLGGGPAGKPGAESIQEH